jgi:serine/threonine protein phosphatase 1
MNRTLVIGDIHGGLKAIHQLFDRAKVTLDDTLIFLGDYVDGWSQSVEVIDFLIELASRQKTILLRGNHDQLVLDWLQGNTENFDESIWFKHGGEATSKAYAMVSDQKKKQHIAFLKSLQDYYLDENNRLFVHAGFSNMTGVKNEYFTETFYWDRTLWEMALSLDLNLPKNHPFYPKRLLLYHEVYIGHTPVTKIGQTVPVNKACVWNIDTGAAFKGVLTIMDVDTKEFWQSDPLPEIYTTEKGRN